MLNAKFRRPRWFKTIRVATLIWTQLAKNAGVCKHIKRNTDTCGPIASHPPEEAREQPLHSGMKRAKQKGNMLGDIHYTLKAFPNHHRALNTVINYRMKNGPYSNNKGIKQPECYFLRAINFAPKDDMSMMLYGLYLHKVNKLIDAEEMYKKALKINPNNLQAMYNYGLLALELGNLEQAKGFAKKVYAKGFVLKGLQRRIDNY